MSDPQQAAILCGGLGTRLRPYTDTLPKPMIPVNGRPFLEYLIGELRDQGITRFALLTGYLGQHIRDHFGDGRNFGVEIAYSEGPAEWDTGRRIWEARSLLEPRFMLNYSDNFVPFNRDRLLQFHQYHKCPLSLLLSRKSGGNIRCGTAGIIEVYDPSRKALGLDYVEIGYMVVERDTVLPLIKPVDISFSTVLQRLVNQGGLAGMVTGDHYHSISDPKRWKLTEDYLAIKRVLLLDRDGTINLRPPRGAYLDRFADLRFVPGTIEGLERLSAAGFRFIVISNQAGVARGIITQDGVDRLNFELRAHLWARGIDVLDFYVCPHHWDDGCDCRKPAAGMFFAASHKHLLRLDRTFYVGDDPRDCLAAANANCPCVYVGERQELCSLERDAAPAHAAPNLLSAAPWIMEHFAEWENNEAAPVRLKISDH
jgi:histidinol-phosphate phosphatase family protein